MTTNIALLLALSATIFAAVESAVTPSEAVSYLNKFGYTPPRDPQKGSLMSAEALEASLRSFQRFAGLPMTGELDRPTLEKMTAKRCGNVDIAGTETARKKRYAKQGSAWSKTDLTYKFINYSPDLSEQQIKDEVRAAFKWWSDDSKLTFRLVGRNDKADIEISFANGAHGDGDPFDGQGKTLAHAYFPGPYVGGDAHFDDGERWQINSRAGGASLRIVAAHEFGHSLGLSHSDVQEALMAPFYNPRSTGLHKDDIAGIRSLYGHPYEKPVVPTTTKRPRTTTRRPRTTTTRKPRTTTTKLPPVGACNGRFDAMTRLTNGSTYAFVNEEFWRLNNEGADEDFPQNTYRVWGIRGKIDSALTYDGLTDIFQGHKVYRFVNGKLLRGYPLHISSVYQGIPSNINAAFQWSGNAKIYFMKGDKYWRFNPNTLSADPGYPKSMANWRGLPNGIDASLQWNERTYFFKDGHYFRFDDENIQVSQSSQYPYPRRTDEWWLGCKDNTLMIRGEGQGKTKTESTEDDPDNAGSAASASTLLLTVSSIGLVISSCFLT